MRCNAREHALGRVSVLFHVRVYDLVCCGVGVSGRIRVRDSARVTVAVTMLVSVAVTVILAVYVYMWTSSIVSVM